jgi:hypothetical protein
MLQLNLLPAHQRTYLQTLAKQYAELLPEAMAVHSLILMFDMLEALECTHQQIEAIFGPEVMLYLTGLLYGAQQAAAGIASPLATLPLITVNGRPIPLLGAVDPAGRIHYGPGADKWRHNGNGIVHVNGN